MKMLAFEFFHVYQGDQRGTVGPPFGQDLCEHKSEGSYYRTY